MPREIEGFGNNPFSSLYGDAPTVSKGASAVSASAYQKARLREMGTGFGAYKRPTSIRTPRGSYDEMAPSTMSSSDYLRKKFGSFAGATEIGPPPPAAVAQVEIMGKTAITEGDLKLLQNEVDREILRLANLRIDALPIQLKRSQLETVANNLADVLGRVGRGEIGVEDVAIFPNVAKTFLRTFRTLETVPTLFDPNGRSPRSMGLVPVASLAPAVASPAVASPAVASPAPVQSNQDLLQWLYENIQSLKWSLEANYDVEEVKHREMQKDLADMERRILFHSSGGNTPMPDGYSALFLRRIRELQAELNPAPE